MLEINTDIAITRMVMMSEPNMNVNLEDAFSLNNDGADPNLVASIYLMQVMLYGQALGDACGVPFLGTTRDTFTCTGLTGHGTFDQPTGTYSANTALMLATLDSLLSYDGQVNQEDLRLRFRDWLDNGRYSADGKVFSIDPIIESALREGHGLDSAYDNTSGSLTHVLPCVLFDMSDEEIREVSAVTHANERSMNACVKFVRIARDIIDGGDVESVLAEYGFAGLADKPREQIESNDEVEHTLEAALWCVATTESYTECVLKAVNLGDNTAGVASLAGSLAAIIYGFEDDGGADGMPESWIEQLQGVNRFMDVILGGPDDNAADEQLETPSIEISEMGESTDEDGRIDVSNLVGSYQSAGLAKMREGEELCIQANHVEDPEGRTSLYRQAEQLLEESFNSGYAPAAVLLGTLYYDGFLDAQDGNNDAKAWYWFNQGYEYSDAECACYLGDMTRDGRGTERSFEKAAEYYEMAFELANANYDLTDPHDIAIFGLINLRLGECYEQASDRAIAEPNKAREHYGEIAFLHYRGAKVLLQRITDLGAQSIGKELQLAKDGYARMKQFDTGHTDE